MLTNAIQPSKQSFADVSENALNRMTNQLVSSMTGSGGRPLTPIQAAQIALISLTTDLSPFLGEVYATDKGIMIGVVAYERKSQEYLDAFLPGTSYHITYRAAIPGKDADFDPTRGDVAYVAHLTRDDWDRQWQVKLQEQTRMLKEIGLTGKEAYELALAQIGERPYAEAVGVVDGREDFGGTYQGGKYNGEQRPEMFDRHDRAKKRGRKNVLKHTFPRLSIPDPMKVLAEDQAGRLVEFAARSAGQPTQIQIPTGLTSEQYEAQLLREIGSEVIVTTARNVEPERQQHPPVDVEMSQTNGNSTHTPDPNWEFSEPPQAKTEQPKPARAKNGNGNILEHWVSLGYFESVAAAANVYNRTPYTKGQYNPDVMNAFAKLYRAWKDADQDTETAISRALNGEVPA